MLTSLRCARCVCHSRPRYLLGCAICYIRGRLNARAQSGDAKIHKFAHLLITVKTQRSNWWDFYRLFSFLADICIYIFSTALTTFIQIKFTWTAPKYSFFFSFRANKHTHLRDNLLVKWMRSSGNGGFDCFVLYFSVMSSFFSTLSVQIKSAQLCSVLSEEIAVKSI